MSPHRTKALHRALLYSSKVMIAAFICWYGLRALGIADPVWAVITVTLVSDPRVETAVDLARVRSINTTVGCLVGMAALLPFGYSPVMAIIAASATIVVIMMIERYPPNWRLAPATVVIVMEAARGATTYRDEIGYALLRMAEIGAGSLVAMLLAVIYSRFLVAEEDKAGAAK